MPEQAFVNHGLDALIEETSDLPLRPVIALATGLGHINLRGNPGNPAFVSGIKAALGQSLPEAAGSMLQEQHRICWLGPDEWLVTLNAGDVDSALQRLETECRAQPVAINNQSGGLIELCLEGSEWRDILARGCAVDLFAESFLPGSCIQAALAKATVLMCRISDVNIRLVVRRSFADYVVRWLMRASPDHKARLTAI